MTVICYIDLTNQNTYFQIRKNSIQQCSCQHRLLVEVTSDSVTTASKHVIAVVVNSVQKCLHSDQRIYFLVNVHRVVTRG